MSNDLVFLILLNSFYICESLLPPLPPLPFLYEVEILESTINYFAALMDTKENSEVGDDGLQLVIGSIQELSAKIEEMESRLSNHIEKTAKIIINRLRLSGNIDSSMKQLSQLIIDVDHLYHQFFHYADPKNEYNNETIRSFAETIISFAPGHLFSLLHRIHRLILPERTANLQESLLILIQKEILQSKADLCGDGISPQLKLFDLYKSIVLTELRGSITAASAYKILSIMKKTKFKREILRVHENFEKRSAEYFGVIKLIMHQTPSFIRSCDAPVTKRDETYIQLTGIYSPYIINQMDFYNANIKSFNIRERTDKLTYSECSSECGTMTADNEKRKCDSEFCHEKSNRCNGKLIDCFFGGGSMEICMSDVSTHRYEWIKDNSGMVYGDDSRGCPENRRKTIGKWNSSILKLFNRCDYCVCTCVAKSNSAKIFNRFSLAPQTSDISSNKVVTGIKFERNGEMVYLKIKEGQLLSNGRVSNVNMWKPTKTVKFNRTISQFQYETGELLIKKQDFLVVADSQDVFLDLDDLVLPENHVLTGIRFKKFDDHHFGLALRATLFNFTTGQLNANKSFWTDLRKDSDENRSEIVLESPINPLDSRENPVLSQGSQTVKFQMSDLKSTAGKFVVPFLDSQPVETNPGFPLAGVGLILKGSKGFGGLIALRIFTYDVKNEIKMPKNLGGFQ